MRFILVIFCAAFFAFNTMPSNAQDQFPEFLLTPNTEILEPVPTDDDNVQITLERPLMRDIIYLQEQINLLESLVERQSSIQKIANNYQKAGIPYKQPPPPASVCRQLPPNILCLFFYPGLDKNKMFIEETKQRIQDQNNQALIDSLENYALGDAPNEKNPEPAPSLQYSWADIECRIDNCTALIVDSNDQDKRFRVKSGEKINPSFKIISVSPIGVTAMLNDRKISLQPVSTDGEIIEQSEPDNSDIDQIISDSSPTMMELPANRVFEGQTNSTQNSGPAPTLGPTGLF